MREQPHHGRELDQADELRRLIEQAKEQTEIPSESYGEKKEQKEELIRTGVLPPRSTVHVKKPLNLVPYYACGVVAAMLLAGIGFWWHTAQSQPVSVPTAASAPAGQAKPTPVKSPTQSSVRNVAKSPASSPVPTPAKQPTAPAPVPVKPQTSTVAGASPAGTKTPQKSVPASKKKRVIRHRVKPGESLYKLSVRYYGTGKYQFYLARYNNIRNSGNVLVGSTVKIPMPPG